MNRGLSAATIPGERCNGAHPFPEIESRQRRIRQRERAGDRQVVEPPSCREVGIERAAAESRPARQGGADRRQQRLQIGGRHRFAGERQLENGRKAVRIEPAAHMRDGAAGAQVALLNDAFVRREIVIRGKRNLDGRLSAGCARHQLQPLAAERARRVDSCAV